MIVPVLALSAALAASTAGGCPVDRETVTGLMNWIGASTDYDVEAAGLPGIVTCAAGEEIDYEAGSLIVDDQINGLYDLERRQVILVEPWDPDDPRDLGVLLHELIHHVQWTSRDWPCVGAPEWEAYKLHDAWLREQGIEAEFDWFTIYLRSRCPRDIHPD